MNRVAIIGGGFAGTVTAIKLARFSRDPLTISIFNRGPLPCRGLAYSAQSDALILNVVARNMSALADLPNHFVDWLRTRSEFAGRPLAEVRESFVPRRLYGDYLHGLFHWTAAEATARGVAIEYHEVNVASARVGSDGIRLLADGLEYTAQKLVLALGNLPPKPLPLADDPRIVQDPWTDWPRRLFDCGQDVLLVGGGLTMIDSFLLLRGLGWRGRIIVLARHPWLPLSHFKGVEYPDFLPDDAAPASLRQMTRLFRQHYKEALARGINPAILVDKLRPFTQRLWQNFSVAEKRRFLRHLKSRWNAARHRVSQTVHERISEAISAGQLQIVQGRVLDATPFTSGLDLRMQCGENLERIRVGAVINCTGPGEDYSSVPLISDLIKRGLAVPDSLGMGLQIAPDFSLRHEVGSVSNHLYALGAILKGTLWETTAVPELRSQAFRLAQTILGHFQQRLAALSLPNEPADETVEYAI